MSRTSSGVRLRETQIIIDSLACLSCSVSRKSRWSGRPDRTRVSQVPQIPSRHEKSTFRPASSSVFMIEVPGFTVSRPAEQTTSVTLPAGTSYFDVEVDDSATGVVLTQQTWAVGVSAS